MTPILSHQDFATEVRSDRLNILWRTTFAGSFIGFWAIATYGMMARIEIGPYLLALLVIASGCLLTRTLLRQDHFAAAVWCYAVGLVASVFILLLTGNEAVTEVTPFIFPVIVFIVGLLLSPRHTLLVVVVAAGLLLFAPSLNPRGSLVGPHQLFALALTIISWLLAAQVTGELYQVTEWALLNYQRERKTTEALHENRELLERALKRSQVLGEELTKANQQLDAARQSAEEAKNFRGQFLANMSHELRTPLNAIIGFSKTMLSFPMMYDGQELPPTYRNDLTQIHRSGQTLLGLINDILDLSKVDAGKLEINMQRVELQPVFDSVLSTAQGLLGDKPVTLETELPESLPDVWADEARIRQVLLNLYSNAVKFTDKGSITLGLRENDLGVIISVRDTGSGIDPLYHEAIFEEFKQANNIGRDPRAGAGLGLAISRQLLDLMDGRIWLESSVGQGSTFSIQLQRYREGLVQPRSRPIRKPALETEKAS